MPRRLGTISRTAAAKIAARQKDREQNQRRKDRANAAARSFRARKADRGKLVFVGVKGQRTPQAKGRKGFLVFVNAKGAKKIVTQFEGKRKRRTFPAAQKLRNVNFENASRHKRALTIFKTVAKTRAGGGTVNTGAIVQSKKEKATGIRFNSNSRAVDKLAGAIANTINRQKSKRVFGVETMILVRDGNGNTFTVKADVKIEKQDFATIGKAGIKNFVARKIYAFIAKELAARGLVTRGSATHVGRLKENKGKARKKWTKNGQAWEGRNLDTVKIERVDYKIDKLDV